MLVDPKEGVYCSDCRSAHKMASSRSAAPSRWSLPTPPVRTAEAIVGGVVS